MRVGGAVSPVGDGAAGTARTIVTGVRRRIRRLLLARVASSEARDRHHVRPDACANPVLCQLGRVPPACRQQISDKAQQIYTDEMKQSMQSATGVEVTEAARVARSEWVSGPIRSCAAGPSCAFRGKIDKHAPNPKKPVAIKEFDAGAVGGAKAAATRKRSCATT